ncbi:DNA methyltransferase [Mycoplasma todarodis]|uniref:Methyltransferase n=1 Tax=Mycoplasma todarodis TaxID=1937191 RepID=A0A4R0XQT7_9MOLU|nr:DNA methyltransferase [Mycoplasma todarodis]TCG11959.1 DNA methylase [Mycoplasma todarodis]
MNTKLETYKKLNAFHKYWGKKPRDLNEFLIKNLTKENDLVIDPFLGAGLISKTAIDLKRNFIGYDINPFSIEYATFLNNLPAAEKFLEYSNYVLQEVEKEINATYTMSHGLATHFIWENDKLLRYWVGIGKNKRIFKPTKDDVIKSTKYIAKNIELRDFTFFNNNKINVRSHFKNQHLFSDRALINIETLLNKINMIDDPEIKRALKLCLTSSSGQMSKMVFVLNKKKGDGTFAEQVGSWAIGLWVPKKHFEINVLKLFDKKIKKLYKILKTKKETNSQNTLNLKLGSCLDEMKKLGSNTLDLIITDPPHGNRIPYLELSDFWNSILGFKPNFNKEIVVSSSKERLKTIANFNLDMHEFMEISYKKLSERGILTIFYNSKNKNEWDFLKNNKFFFLGSAKCIYSSNSLVQRNRSGAMKYDYILFFSKTKQELPDNIQKLPGWTKKFPEV